MISTPKQQQQPQNNNIIIFIFLLFTMIIIDSSVVPSEWMIDEVLFHEDFSTGSIEQEKWMTYGVSSTTYVMNSFAGRNNVCNLNGDSYCDSGIIYKLNSVNTNNLKNIAFTFDFYFSMDCSNTDNWVNFRVALYSEPSYYPGGTCYTVGESPERFNIGHIAIWHDNEHTFGVCFSVDGSCSDDSKIVYFPCGYENLWNTAVFLINEDEHIEAYINDVFVKTSINSLRDTWPELFSTYSTIRIGMNGINVVGTGGVDYIKAERIETKSCSGNRDPLFDCQTCKNHWINDNNNCSTCPLENSDINSTSCSECLGNWDLEKNCSECLANWNKTTNCSSCKSGYYGSSCNIFSCLDNCNDPVSGICVSPDNCTCNQDYFGESCEYCRQETFCNTRGWKCLNNDGMKNCFCNQHFSGQFCQRCDIETFCNNASYSCENDNGDIICNCLPGYYGVSCNEWDCDEFPKDDFEVCSSSGTCIEPNVCQCKDGFINSYCDSWTCPGYDCKEGCEEIIYSQITNLISLYSFTEGSLQDSININHGVSSSNMFEEADSALEFNGLNDYVYINHNSNLNVGYGDFSLSAWIKSETKPSFKGRIISKGGAIYSSHFPGYLLGIDKDGKVLLNIVAPFPNDALYSSNQIVTDGEWHFIVGVVKRDEGFKIYIDGELDFAAAIDTSSYNLDNNQRMTFGCLQVGSYGRTHYYEGIVDEISVYRESLSEGIIYQLYECGISRLSCIINQDSSLYYEHTDSRTCYGHGKCVAEFPDGVISCECEEGWNSNCADCEDSVAQKACNKRNVEGSCYSNGFDIVCQCQDGYFGQHCENCSIENFCNNENTEKCENIKGRVKCVCKKGYTTVSKCNSTPAASLSVLFGVLCSIFPFIIFIICCVFVIIKIYKPLKSTGGGSKQSEKEKKEFSGIVYEKTDEQEKRGNIKAKKYMKNWIIRKFVCFPILFVVAGCLIAVITSLLFFPDVGKLFPIIPGVVFFICFIIIPCCLCCCACIRSSTTTVMDGIGFNKENTLEIVLNYFNRIKRSHIVKPFLHVRCSHTERRTRSVSYRDSDGKTKWKTESYTVTVTTYRDSKPIPFDFVTNDVCVIDKELKDENLESLWMLISTDLIVSVGGTLQNMIEQSKAQYYDENKHRDKTTRVSIDSWKLSEDIKKKISVSKNVLPDFVEKVYNNQQLSTFLSYVLCFPMKKILESYFDDKVGFKIHKYLTINQIPIQAVHTQRIDVKSPTIPPQVNSLTTITHSQEQIIILDQPQQEEHVINIDNNILIPTIYREEIQQEPVIVQPIIVNLKSDVILKDMKYEPISDSVYEDNRENEEEGEEKEDD